MLNLIRKGDDFSVNRIILIRDCALDKKGKKYIKATIPYNGNIVNASETIVSGVIVSSVYEEYCDITELLMNQIVASAMLDVSMKNIYIVDSNTLQNPNKTYSSKTIRYFVRKRKENGDIFLFVGNNRTSRLIAKLWGFKQVHLL